MLRNGGKTSGIHFLTYLFRLRHTRYMEYEVPLCESCFIIRSTRDVSFYDDVADIVNLLIAEILSSFIFQADSCVIAPRQ